MEDGTPTDDRDLVPYVELTDANGRRLTFSRRGGLASADWRSGDLLVQQLNLTVPVSLTDGEYPLRLGLSMPDDNVDSPPEAEGVAQRAAVLRVRTAP